MNRIPPVTRALLIANVLVFVVQALTGDLLVGTFALWPMASAQYPGAPSFEIWQLLTYGFLHGSLTHLMFNMLALYMFGAPLERHLGSAEFLLFYFVTGIGAGLATLAVNWYSGLGYVPVVGASGAIFGLLLAFATYFPDTRILFMFFIPMRAPMAVLVFAGIELFSMFTGTRSGVAHLTHLAGLAFGWLYLVVRLGINPARVFFRRRW
jgi:membrane associated rhomboid family serine protease